MAENAFNLLVGDPQPFATPMIRESQLSKLHIRGSNGNFIVVDALIVGESNNFFEIGRKLRDSIFGHVASGEKLQASEIPGLFLRTGIEVAIKFYYRHRLQTLNKKTAENPLMEIGAMQHIGCYEDYNIIGQLECCMDIENVYSVMPYYSGGELLDKITENGPLSNKQAKIFFRQLLHALEKLQSLGIAHRDMSLENILWTIPTNNNQQEQGHGANAQQPQQVNNNNEEDHQMYYYYVVIDLGMCLRLPSHPTEAGIWLPIPKQSICGKNNYMAPEVLRRDSIFQPMLCDIWATGIILFMVLTGLPPIDRATDSDERFNLITGGRLRDLIQFWGLADQIDSQAIDLIQSILQSNPLARPTIQQMRNHVWLRSADHNS